MRTIAKTSLHRVFALALCLGLALGRTATAEDPNFTATTVELPSLPEAPAKPPQQEPDRKDQAGAAAAMAAVGAAIAGASCAMLLRQAAQEMDPAKKAQLRAQAMQQCAQAAQNAASAGQNEDQKNMLTFDDSPKGELAYKPEVKDYRQTEQKAAAATSSSSDSNSSNELADNSTDEPQPEVFDYTGKNTPVDISKLGSSGAGAESASVLQPIQPQTLDFDESAKYGGTTPSQTAGPMQFSAASSTGAFSNGLLQNLASQTADAAASLKKGKRKIGSVDGDANTAASGGGDDHGHGSGSSGGDGHDMSSMLSKIMGGGKEGEEASEGAQLARLVSDKKESGLDRPVNIFQYATYRFKRTRRDGDLRRGTVALNPPANSALTLVRQ